MTFQSLSSSHILATTCRCSLATLSVLECPGVGMGRKPNPVYLYDGDVMSLSISGLGEQRQTVVGSSSSDVQARSRIIEQSIYMVAEGRQRVTALFGIAL